MIAADLHDDIGAGLTEISILVEVAGSKLAPEPRAVVAGELDRIGEVARSMVSGMSDIVWLVRPRNDTTNTISGHGQQTMRQRAGKLGADLNVRSQPGEGTTVAVSWRVRRR